MRRALKFCPFDQKTHASYAVPSVGIESKRQLDPGRKRFGVAKPDAIHGLALVFEFECEVFLANQSLRHDLHFFTEGRGRKALAPDFLV